MGKVATSTSSTYKRTSETIEPIVPPPKYLYRLCCCCLELVCLKSLWSEYSWMGRTEVYGNMLKECFNLTWPQSDKVTEQICEVCITQLRHAVYFKQKVIQCQETIRSQLTDLSRPLKEEQLENENKIVELGTDIFTNSESTQCNNQIDALTDDDHDVLAEDISDEDIFTNSESTQCNNQIDALTDDDHDVLAEDISDEDTPLIKAEDINADNSDIFKDGALKEPVGRKTVKRKITDIKKGKRRKLYASKKRDKVDRRKMNYIKPRQNVCLILEHSTILPFKSNKGYFNCLYCNKQFVGFDELKTHISESHQNISFKSILKSIRRPHDRIRADVSDISCRICKKKLDNLDFLIKHLTDDHSVKFDFNDAMKPTDCILAYDLSDGKYRCYQCKDEFLFFKTLSKHMNDHSTDHVCDVCGRCFLLPERLRAHAQMHNIGKSVKCEFCGKICSSNILLKSHIRYTHKKLSFMCSICDETFPSCRTRMRHLEEVHNRAPLNLTCKICSKKFGTPNSLNSHIRSDHINLPKEPKHGCHICGMLFKSRHALSCHTVVHSGEKNYECQICHKKYARAKTLTEHLKIHMNDRRWSCGACSQAFVQKCSLKNHIRVHHVDMNFEQLIVDKKPDGK